MTTPEPRFSVLIVEDEAMIRMMVADMLEDIGYHVAGEAASIEEAMQLARSAQFDVAVLDVNLNGKSIEPVADVIDSRKLPLIFASGYGVSGLPEKFRDRPALQKPFQMEALQNMLETVLGRKAA
jgi:CheY-like chemotaxis protein